MLSSLRAFKLVGDPDSHRPALQRSYLDVSSNLLVGTIPDGMTALTAMTYVANCQLLPDVDVEVEM